MLQEFILLAVLLNPAFHASPEAGNWRVVGAYEDSESCQTWAGTMAALPLDNQTAFICLGINVPVDLYDPTATEVRKF